MSALLLHDWQNSNVRFPSDKAEKYHTRLPVSTAFTVQLDIWKPHLVDPN